MAELGGCYVREAGRVRLWPGLVGLSFLKAEGSQSRL